MRWGWLVALVALAIADPALADVTARFAQPDGQPIVIQVNDRGDSRMSVTDCVYVTRDGATQMILTMGDSTFVARQEDFLAVMAEFLALQGPASDDPNRRIGISEHGRETVAGHEGTLFRVGDAARGDVLEFVISADPALAPIGQVFRAQFLPFFSQGHRMPGLAEAMANLLSRGALIRFGNLIRLEAVETTPVPAAAFAVPSAPISRDALRSRILSEAGR